MKFSFPSYGLEVHRLLEKHQYAPRLIDNALLPGGWHAVVMEKIEGKPIVQGEVLPGTRKQLEAIQKLLTESGLVHGDLRSPNILVDDKHDVKVIDFDWAGKATVARYPANINLKSGEWHQSVARGELILPEHDKFCLSKFI